MIRGAGILYLTKNNRALFLKRGPGGDWPGFWCFPGGTTEGAETPEQTALREAEEELGFVPSFVTRGNLTKHAVTIVPTMTAAPGEPPALVPDALPPENVEFTTFIQRVSDEFEPRINGEHVGYAWAPIDQPPLPIHPGCLTALKKIGWHELDVAKAIRDGELASPQQYENMWLFALRITGTGVAFRKKLNEYAYRRPENYLTEEFLARCNGLAVIVKHPKGDKLDSREFADRIVGTMFLPYVKGDEVWGIAKIYDETTALMLSKFQLSTSPAVVLFAGASTAFKTEDGETVLFEGKAKLIDHLAICEKGVWDKGGDPAGVAVETIGDSQMPDEKKEDKKGDMEIDLAKEGGGSGDAGQKLDTMLKGLHGKLDDCMGKFDAAMNKCDAVMKRMDSMEDERKKADTAKADADKKEEEKKADAKKDAEKEDKKEEGKKDAASEDKDMAKEVVADKKKDAAEDDKKEEKKGDAMKDHKADSGSGDTGKIAALEVQIAEMRGLLPAQMTDEDYRRLSDVQERADQVFTAFGQRAPIPLRGETVRAYRQRLATKLKPNSGRWKGIDLNVVADDAAFTVAENDIYTDATAAANSPDTVPEGMLRPRSRKTASGHTITEFHGQPHAWMNQFASTRRFVTKINPKPSMN